MREIDVEIEELRIEAKVDEAGIQDYTVFIWSEVLCEDLDITSQLSNSDRELVEKEIENYLENEEEDVMLSVKEASL